MTGTNNQPTTTTSPPVSPTGHPLPRRTAPGDSVTLRHHKVARDASLRAMGGKSPKPTKDDSDLSSPRRNSTGDSHETRQSDPKMWFDHSNENPTATFDNNLTEVDPPFYLKESESSEERPFYPQQHLPAKLVGAQSSSADDYRSVIDDLTVEIQKLKEELKRYKQKGPDMLRKEKLFEIKIHGLPKTKRRELESTLRDFTESLDGSPDASYSQRKKSSKHNTRDTSYSRADSGFKNTSSSSGSNPRPTDSAYASMSTGANSSGTSLGRPSISARTKSSEEKIESYLRDIPEGLYPRPVTLTDRERKRLVVRRLEQLFTGKMGGRNARKARVQSPQVPQGPSGVMTEETFQQDAQLHQPPALLTVATTAEPSREARILPEKQSGHHTRKSRSGGNDSTSNSNSNGDTADSNGNSSGSRTNVSPPTRPPPEQRPTRPTDLDPDRKQNPNDNMDYIRHLGLVPPELLAETYKAQDVRPDADGWVYLNLLCSLAQLHMINVTPSFVRVAVADMSTKFQLSPDGRKIRWRGGNENTRFSSDSSTEHSQKSPDTEDTDSSNRQDQRKRQKTGHSTGDDFQSGGSSKRTSKLDNSTHSDSFHYKPMFAHQESLGTQRSGDETSSSLDPAAEESTVDESAWGQIGTAQNTRRKRRRDGAIIYYSGAPFCTDLSGDSGDVSPVTYMQSSGQGQGDSYDSGLQTERSGLSRSVSGSLLSSRPLCEKSPFTTSSSDTGLGGTEDSLRPGTESDDSMDEDTWELTWSDDSQQKSMIPPLEPCGLGGVTPEDHFTVIVSTMRPKYDGGPVKTSSRSISLGDKMEGVIGRSKKSEPTLPTVECKYVSGRIKRLDPHPLPPPAMFFQHRSTESSMDLDETSEEEESREDESEESDESSSLRAHPHQSDDYPDGVDLSSGDEDGEDLDEEADVRQMQHQETNNMEQRLPERRRRTSHALSNRSRKASSDKASVPQLNRQRSSTTENGARARGSSAATAGGVKSGYSSDDSSS